MAEVLILSLVFPPDGVSTAQLLGEIAEDLTKHGHRVSVITTVPHYNRDAVAEAQQPMRRRWGGLLYESEFRGIRVLHTAMPKSRRNLPSRMIGWASFHLLSFVAGVTSVARPAVIMVPSPLLTAGVVAWWIARIRRARYIYNVQELYPDLAIEMGRLRNPVLIKLLRVLEQFVYANAAATTGISRSICNSIVQRGAQHERVHLIPNFVDVEELRPATRVNGFRDELGLADAFVVSYAGNMGFAQGLEKLLEAAVLLKEESRIRFIFVGDGVLKSRLLEHAHAEGLQNTSFISHQPYARMPEIYGASDVSLVPLMKGASGSALPSKIFRIMACARPVVAICDPDGELANIVQTAEAGVVVAPGEAAVLAAVVRDLARNPQRCAAMGEAGRRYVETSYAREIVTGRYAQLVASVASGN